MEGKHLLDVDTILILDSPIPPIEDAKCKYHMEGLGCVFNTTDCYNITSLQVPIQYSLRDGKNSIRIDKVERVIYLEITEKIEVPTLSNHLMNFVFGIKANPNVDKNMGDVGKRYTSIVNEVYLETRKKEKYSIKLIDPIGQYSIYLNIGNVSGTLFAPLCGMRAFYVPEIKYLAPEGLLQTPDSTYREASIQGGNKIMKKCVIIVNGRGGSGKDTLIEHVQGITFRNISAIEPIKAVAADLGWNPGQKTDKDRKFLSDLKALSIAYNDYPTNWVLERYKGFLKSNIQILFIHIREPKEIDKMKEYITAVPCYTILVKRNETDNVSYGNASDDGVENYDYDFTFHNDREIEFTSPYFQILCTAMLHAKDKKAIDDALQEMGYGYTYTVNHAEPEGE